MKIAIIGYGKMGKMVETAALEMGHDIAAIVDDNESISAASAADVCIEFTNPESVVENIRQLTDMRKNIVVGTTGWYDQMDEIVEIVKKKGVGLLYSPNFSIGVQLFLQIVNKASKLINALPEFDVAGYEMHHNQKEDRPSGTALALGNAILNAIDRKNELVCDLEGVVKSNQLHFSSVRCGSEAGEHSIVFDGPTDRIHLTHRAKGREGFARGAVQAAEWLHGKQGLYSMEELLRAISNERFCPATR